MERVADLEQPVEPRRDQQLLVELWALCEHRLPVVVDDRKQLRAALSAGGRHTVVRKYLPL